MTTFSHSLMPLMIHRELLGRGQEYLKFSPAENLCARCLASYSPRVPRRKGPFEGSETICQQLPSHLFPCPGLLACPPLCLCTRPPSVSVTIRSGVCIRNPKTITAPTGQKSLSLSFSWKKPGVPTEGRVPEQCVKPSRSHTPFFSFAVLTVLSQSLKWTFELQPSHPCSQQQDG